MKSLWTSIIISIVAIFVFSCSPKTDINEPAINTGEGFFYFRDKTFSNAGVYTMPTRGSDPYPYSLEGLDLTDEDLEKIFSLNFLILLGEEDVVQDAYFLKSKAAMRQGENRLQRGKKFYSIAKKEAQRLNSELKWQIITIPGCGHNPNDEMINMVIGAILGP